MNPQTGSIFECEFGTKGGDEINIIQKGLNYGWRVITYGREYWGPKIGDTHANGMEQPLIYWTPSISPSAISFYKYKKLTEFKNYLFVAALGSQHIRLIKMRGDKIVGQKAYLENLGQRFRHILSSPDGYIYTTTDAGNIYRIEGFTKKQ